MKYIAVFDIPDGYARCANRNRHVRTERKERNMSELIDRQALKNKICDCCEGKDEWCNSPCFEIMIIDSMPAIAAHSWHMVDEPPEENGRYLVSWEGVVTTDEYKDGVWLYSSMFNQRLTHWMPIPEPPKEDSR